MNDPAPVQDALAPLSRRAAAQLIDTLLVTLPVLAIASALGAFEGDGLDTGGLLAVTALQVGLNIVYETVAIAVWAMTVGKRIVGIQVVRSDDGGAVTWTYACVRSLVPSVALLVPVIGPGLGVVVYLRAFFHPLRQGIHDAAAGTLVVVRR